MKLVLTSTLLGLAATATTTAAASDCEADVPTCLIITGVIDGPLSGGVPKAVELFAACDVADLAEYGLGSATNGGGTDGVEFEEWSGAVAAGEFLYVSSETDGFTTYFGFPPDYTDSALSVNGDDGIDLFRNAEIVDVYGDANDAETEGWGYQDGWSYRVAGSLPCILVNSGGCEWVADGLDAGWELGMENVLDGYSSQAETEGSGFEFPLATYELGDWAPCGVDYATYAGVQIAKDEAIFSMGENADVKLVRDGASSLNIIADVDVTGSISVNGQSLREMVEEMVAEQLATTTAAATTVTYGSCHEWFMAFSGNLADGEYDVTVDGESLTVYCDMRNGGWTRVVNVLTDTSQSSYVTPDAVNAGTASSTAFYKLSDAQINGIAGSAGTTDYLYVCSDEVELVARTTEGGEWTSLRDQGGWVIDRDVDGQYDCTADRPGYIFADYSVDGYSGEALHDDEDCSTGMHTNFGEDSSNTGCYVASSSGWAQAASVWVGGQLAVNQAISNCIGLDEDCSYSAHFDKYYDITR